MPAIMTYDFMCGLAQYAKVREQPSKQRKVTTYLVQESSYVFCTQPPTSFRPGVVVPFTQAYGRAPTMSRMRMGDFDVRRARAQSRNGSKSTRGSNVASSVTQLRTMRFSNTTPHRHLRADIQVDGKIRAYHAQAHECRHPHLPALLLCWSWSHHEQYNSPDRAEL